MPDKCPACQNFIYVSRGIRGSQGTDEYGDPYPFWTDDPIKTPLGLSGENWKGRDASRYVYLQELRDYYNYLETTVGLSTTSWSEALSKGNPFRKVYIEELRIVVERILNHLGKTIVDYFKYDRHGEDTGSTQTDWTDVDRTSGYPLLPAGKNPGRAIYIEELRRGIYSVVWVGWIERFLVTKSKGVDTPPSNPIDGDRYIVGTGTPGTDWEGKDNQVATWNDNTSSWEFADVTLVNWCGWYEVPFPTPERMLRAQWVEDENKWYAFDYDITQTWIEHDRDKYVEGSGMNNWVTDYFYMTRYADWCWSGMMRIQARSLSAFPAPYPNTAKASAYQKGTGGVSQWYTHGEVEACTSWSGQNAWSWAYCSTLMFSSDYIKWVDSADITEIYVEEGVYLKVTGSQSDSISYYIPPGDPLGLLYGYSKYTGLNVNVRKLSYSSTNYVTKYYWWDHDPSNGDPGGDYEVDWWSMTRDFYTDFKNMMQVNHGIDITQLEYYCHNGDWEGSGSALVDGKCPIDEGAVSLIKWRVTELHIPYVNNIVTQAYVKNADYTGDSVLDLSVSEIEFYKSS